MVWENLPSVKQQANLTICVIVNKYSVIMFTGIRYTINCQCDMQNKNNFAATP